MTTHNKHVTSNIKPKSFMLFHAFSFNGGPMLITSTVGAYFLVFMTDTMMIPAASAALIMLIGSIWDICNDPFIGVIADKTHTRWGRYRPYFLFVPIFFAISSVLLFLNPESLTINEKVYFVGAAYLMYGTFFTLMTMPHTALLPAVTRDNDYRNKVVTLGAIAMSMSFTIGMSGTPTMLTWTNGSYVPIVALYGLLTVVMYWGLFLTSKEKYVVYTPKSEKKCLKRELGTLLKHKELYSISSVWVFSSMGYALMFGTSVYYLLYYVGRPDLISSYMATISIGAFISMAVCMPLTLKYAKSGHKALYWSQSITFVCYAICYFWGSSNISILFIFSGLATVFGGMAMGLINILVNDLIDFMQVREGLNMNGTIASIKGFCQKLGQSYMNAGVLGLLATFGYIAGAIGQQPEQVETVLNIVRFGLPAILCLLTAIMMKNYALKEFVAERDNRAIEKITQEEEKEALA